ncbi:tudor domain-containing protein 3-like [Dermacentor variabilis]|uniref:tudor domain-containing protein 3-like n=1 Tax=Dermacentor variabilis TaxID=34621 RepID=UPI003F5C1C4B
MGLPEELKDRGWFLSAEGLEECIESLENPKPEDVIRKAVNFDLADIGEGGLPEDVSRNKVDSITGPVVVQIQKIRNVAAPKSNPESDHSPRLLRLHLYDGTSYCSAIQWGRWNNISLSTPPGSKILLKSEPIPVVNGFLLLAEHNFKFLGGNVAHLIEKWELAKNLSHHKRTAGEEGGAPPWVPFGQKIDASRLKNLKGGFKSMDLCQKDTKPNESFEKHRQMTIAEISRAKEGKVKVFGGGKQQPQDGDIAQLVGLGYSVDAAVSALKTHNCDIAAAMQALELSDRNRRERANRPETGRKRREPRERDSGDEKAPSRPSGPSTLFDYLQNQISLPKVPDVEDSHLGDQPSEVHSTHDHSNRGGHSSSKGRANGPSSNSGRFGQQQQHLPSQRYRGHKESSRGEGDHSYQNHLHDGFSSGFYSNNAGPYNRHRVSQESGGPPQQSRTYQGNHNNRSHPRQSPVDGGDRRRMPQACDLAPGSRPAPRGGDRSFSDSKSSGTKRLFSGQKVLAKYWEDGKFYRALVHEVSANGNTCVVKFVDYGNHEEVLCSDVQTVSLAQWDKGQSSSSRQEYHRQAGSGGTAGGGGGGGSQHGPPPQQHQQQQQQFSSSRDSEDYRYLEAMMQNEAANAAASQQPQQQHHHQQPQQHHQPNYHHHQQQQQHNYQQQQQQHHHQPQYQPQQHHHRPPTDGYEHGGYRQRPPPQHHKPQHHQPPPFGGGQGRPQQQYYQPPAQRRQPPT